MHRPFLTITKSPSIATVTRYAYLNTLVSALSKRLLSAEQLRNLVDQSASDVSVLLRTAGLTGISLQAMEDRSLEQVLVDTLWAEAQRLIRPLSAEAQELASYWLRRFEIGNLKIVLRGKLTGRPKEAIQADLIKINGIAALPLNSLMEAEDAQEVLHCLEGTPYAGVARQARSVYGGEHYDVPHVGGEGRELFLIEATIDREYYSGLARRVNAIQEERDRHYLRILIGYLIDQTNLVWLLRYRFAYRLGPPLTYFLLCPGGYHLRSQHLLALARGENFEETLHNLPAPLAPLVAGAVSTSEVEEMLGKHLLEVAQFILKRTTFNLGRAFAYLFLREKELLRIHGIIKGRTLQLAPHLIHQAMGLESAGFKEDESF
ncbi:H+-transporting two-sector ATPase, C (AC39) subunit [Nitrosococcus oceani ATCC 19707]|uniref:H+-transporting two-sector ATPase, C (AC39) subunit n=2 Tax=Nitrosococcus oceani TaxID=1229 RepID=Q3J9E8_NITOC|nr:V-type ATPase subunit [Nitrosococcus oceani]ABA58548.1 H+-transporting two-sector ATPase, C (AC39) subunit [Nitrosococcus oceani ATCC 19707]EDZ66798.1 ATP synthase, subunit C [Nitrosococcus oceani AFC27]KFI19031.1 ATPase [Nitrosococcus oceani C-27]GEM19667.1 ATPase [Nitrosococcus oceani]